ncbi:MAG: hypothetical protein P4L63_03295 [Candidatus Pacebacteria bacterium]|nr:hypothetical protein [Candidatus Paceibacterota bacterium]
MSSNNQMEVLQRATEEVNRLCKLLKKSKPIQVKSKEEQQIIKATALAWFNNHRPNLNIQDSPHTKEVEFGYTQLFEYTSHAVSREKYQSVLKKLKLSLISLQSESLSASSSYASDFSVKPDFSPLTSNLEMQKILDNRWSEIIKCLNCTAPLAATIMMGGLLEALFLARINKLIDKGPVYKAKAAPLDSKTKKVIPLERWMLNSYIEVGAELGWIRRPAKDIGIVLRDYRNFIHPERELSTGFTLEQEGALLFWQMFNQVSRQIIMSASR